MTMQQGRRWVKSAPANLSDAEVICRLRSEGLRDHKKRALLLAMYHERSASPLVGAARQEMVGDTKATRQAKRSQVFRHA